MLILLLFSLKQQSTEKMLPAKYKVKIKVSLEIYNAIGKDFFLLYYNNNIKIIINRIQREWRKLKKKNSDFIIIKFFLSKF